MTVLLSELYDALREAGAPDDKARKAAEAVAAYDNRFGAMDLKLERLEGRVNTLTYMVGTNIGLTLLVLGKLFIP